MIDKIMRLLGYSKESIQPWPGTIIARNERLDEIMVEEPDGTVNRYKKVSTS